MRVYERPEFGPLKDPTVAGAANELAKEAFALGCVVKRPFNGVMVEAHPDRTAAHTVMWWHESVQTARDAYWEEKVKKLQESLAVTEQYASYYRSIILHAGIELDDGEEE